MFFFFKQRTAYDVRISYWSADVCSSDLKRLLMGATAADEFTVVGVVADTRYRSLRDAMASVYFPLAQSRFPFAPTRLAIRAAGAPADLVPTIRRVDWQSVV